mmetsp:Transcript_70065/g.194734  ORF Transcript_70065/g.194734 Transcript_70065/m.194734 type:complete len:995 (-) Transcript_70065:200-3184(-)|eukprot:CAMPEP_0117595410 /NCGR_PEP_ID=MMETSP0784-20121206/73745_1 /TAXON_ID=39447 /ORGANISM="" /LENGTH=994 /DNA_ID=CAMNT_0005397585 /DNA_START=104 /DNA_END=3088 /DNA_ORIENTATION=+
MGEPYHAFGDGALGLGGNEDFLPSLGNFIGSELGSELGMDMRETTLSCVFCKVDFKSSQATRSGKCEVKLLQCFHSACGHCLERFVRDGSPFQCPACDTTVEGQNYDHYLSNFPENECIDNWAVEQQKSIACEECVEENPAVKYCVQCFRKLCVDCSRHHQRSKTTSTHKLSTLEERQAESMHRLGFCALHPHWHLEFFCQTCGHMCCRECIACDHEHHEYKLPVGAVVARHRDLVADQVHELRTIARLIHKRHQYLTRSIRECDTELGNARMSVDKIVMGVDVSIQERRQALLSEIDAFKANRQGCLEEQRAAITSNMVSMWQTIDFVERTLDTGTAMEILFLKGYVNAGYSNCMDSALSVVREALMPAKIVWHGTLISQVAETLKGMAGVVTMRHARGVAASSRARSGIHAEVVEALCAPLAAEALRGHDEDTWMAPSGQSMTTSSGAVLPPVVMLPSSKDAQDSEGGAPRVSDSCPGSSNAAVLDGKVTTSPKATQPAPAAGRQESGGEAEAPGPTRVRRRRRGGASGRRAAAAAAAAAAASAAAATSGATAVPHDSSEDGGGTPKEAEQNSEPVVLKLGSVLDLDAEPPPRIPLARSLPGPRVSPWSVMHFMQQMTRPGTSGRQAVPGCDVPTKIFLHDAVVDGAENPEFEEHPEPEGHPGPYSQPPQQNIELECVVDLRSTRPCAAESGVHSLGNRDLVNSFGTLRAIFGSQGEGFACFLSPCGLAVDSALIYVADTLNHRIQVFDKKSHKYLGQVSPYSQEIGDLRDPSGVSVIGDRHLAIVEYGLDRVVHIQLSKDSFDIVRSIKLEESLYGPFGCACGQNRIYVADSCHHRCVVCDLSGRRLFEIGSRGVGPGQFEYPTCIVIFSDAGFAVGDRDNNRLQVFNSAGKFSHYIPSDWTVHDANRYKNALAPPPGKLQGPMGIGCDRNNRIYVCDCGSNRLQIFTRRGEWLWSSDTGEHKVSFQSPTAVAIDEAGLVYIASDHCVQIF